jgi:hypothetical protein
MGSNFSANYCSDISPQTPNFQADGPPSDNENTKETAAGIAETPTTIPGTTLSEDAPASKTEGRHVDIESNIFLYRDSYFHVAANIIGTLISTLIPIAAIIVLYFVSDMSTRLAMVCLFTALFSVALSLVTAAKRVEIFAATAA